MKEVGGYQRVSHFLSQIEGLGGAETKALLIFWETTAREGPEKSGSVVALLQKKCDVGAKLATDFLCR